MTDVRLMWLLRQQEDLVAWWQLFALGWSARKIDDHARRHRWQVIHEGVYCVARGRLSRVQRWIAATLTAPGTLLYGASAAACWGFRRWRSTFEMVVRHGSGGPEHLDGLRVARSVTLNDEIAWRGPIPLTSPERTLIDMSSSLSDAARGRATREAIRMGLTTAPDLLDALARHRGRRGTAPLRVLAKRYAQLPIARTRSDAEGKALENLYLSGLPIPDVNVKVGKFEADLVDHANKRIIEIDGPQFHLFPDEDEMRDTDWGGEGYAVTRLPSGRVYAERRS
jgi:hypothetical protein